MHCLLSWCMRHRFNEVLRFYQILLLSLRGRKVLYIEKNNIKCKEKGKDNLRDTLRSLKWAIRALLITWMSLQGQR